MINIRVLELIYCGIQEDNALSDSSAEFNWLRGIIDSCQSLKRFAFRDFVIDEHITQPIAPVTVLRAASSKKQPLRDLDLDIGKRSENPTAILHCPGENRWPTNEPCRLKFDVHANAGICLFINDRPRERIPRKAIYHTFTTISSVSLRKHAQLHRCLRCLPPVSRGYYKASLSLHHITKT